MVAFGEENLKELPILMPPTVCLRNQTLRSDSYSLRIVFALNVYLTRRKLAPGKAA